MSLLLDALQRASDEKEGAASLDAPASPPLTFADTPPAVQEKPLQAAAAATTATPTSTPTTSATPTATAAAATISPHVAREILNATAKSGGSGSRKKPVALFLLGGLLLLGAGSFFLGLWDDLLEPAPQPIRPKPPAGAKLARPAQPPAPPAVPSSITPPTATPAPVPAPQAALPKKSIPANETTPVRKAPAEALFTSGPRHESPMNAAKPVFVAKPGSAKTLDSGYAALTEGRLDDASAAYRLALKNNPEERDALLGLAHIAHRQGRPDEARMLYQRVLHQDPTQATATAGLLALQTDEDIPAATSRAQEATERTPESAAAFATLGNLLVREGRLADAQQAFFRAMSLEPENCFHAYNLAVALDRLHKYDLAQRYYKSALALAEKSPAGVQSSFPKESAQRRHEQLRNRVREDRPALP